jgi:hypothetical protein
VATAQQIASPGVYVTDDIGLEVTDGVNSRVQLGLLPTGGAGTYGLRVVSSDGTTVIVDGTSDMFRISASGSTSVTIGANSSGLTTVSLTGLGTLSATPANLCYLSNANNNAASQSVGFFFVGAWNQGMWVADAFLGTTNSAGMVMTGGLARAYTYLDGSNICQVEVAGWTGSAATFYCHYYILAQAAI